MGATLTCPSMTMSHEWPVPAPTTVVHRRRECGVTMVQLVLNSTPCQPYVAFSTTEPAGPKFLPSMYTTSYPRVSASSAPGPE